MIKTLISLTIFGSLVGVYFAYPDIFMIMLLIKGSLIYYFGYVFSKLAIFVILAETTWVVAKNITKKL